MDNKLTKRETIDFLEIPEKDFKNYFDFSKEIQGEKIGNRWYFDKTKLSEWKKLKEERTIHLTMSEYETGVRRTFIKWYKRTKNRGSSG